MSSSSSSSLSPHLVGARLQLGLGPLELEGLEPELPLRLGQQLGQPLTLRLLFRVSGRTTDRIS
jgi:hypothetical protein